MKEHPFVCNVECKAHDIFSLVCSYNLSSVKESSQCTTPVGETQIGTDDNKEVMVPDVRVRGGL